jgi:hypothetical protein
MTRANRGTDESFGEDLFNDASSGANYTPRYAVTTTKRKRSNVAWIIVLVLLLLCSAGGLGWWWLENRPTGLTSNAPVWTPGMAVTPQVSETIAQPPAGCVTTGTEFVPTKFSFLGKDKDLNVLSLGLDANGAAAAPPTTDPMTFAWFNQGPKPGSDKGKVVLSGHTYTRGKAIGNYLNNGLLSYGDYMLVSDDSGNSACYMYDNQIQVYVADYDPNSNILYDNDGPAEVAIVVCTDYEASAHAHVARAIYYGSLVTAVPAPATASGTAQPAASASQSNG